MIVTFDFDDTLCFIDGSPNWPLINKLKEHSSNGDIVHIVTTRYNGEENKLYIMEFVEKHSLPISSIHFTDGSLKGAKVFELGSSIHYDDNKLELSFIDRISQKSNSKITGVYSFDIG